MQFFLRRSVLALALVGWGIVVFGTGCGGSGQQAEGPSGPSAKDGLLDLHELLKEVAEKKQKLPKNKNELAAIEPLHPAVAAYIQNGAIQYSWGAQLAPGGTQVIAYETDVPTKGGWVLLQDGTVKQLTADEYKAAPKPSGK